MADETRPAASTASPTREEWSALSHGLCQLIRDGMHCSYNAFLAEAVVLGRLSKLRQLITLDGSKRRLRCVVRGYETSPADAWIIVVGDDVESLPADDATEYETWKWARTHPRGVRFLAIDVKLLSLSAGCKTDIAHPHSLQWSKTNKKRSRQRVDDYEVVFAVIEGAPNRIAVLPTQTWIKNTNASYWVEVLTSGTPVELSTFLIHMDDIGECVVELALTAAVEDHTYINVTTRRPLHGMKPALNSQPSMDPSGDQKGRMMSFDSTLKIFAEIETCGCRPEFNRVQPYIHDFYVWIPECGPVRFEAKDYGTWEDLMYYIELDPRADPFSRTRLWHVLYIKLGGKAFCITRDELVGIDGTPSLAWVKERACSGFSHALGRIKQHWAAASREALRALLYMRPSDVCRTLPNRQLKLDAVVGDPLGGHTGRQLTLPWVSHQINVLCMEGAYGVCLQLGQGNRLGTHVVLHYYWTPADQVRFRRFGKLPKQFGDKGVSEMRCLVLRFLDFSPRGSKPWSEAFDIPRACWKKAIEGGRHFLILASTLNYEMQRSGEPESADYLLLPSHFTALSSDRDLLPRPRPTELQSGAHYFSSPGAAATELTSPSWPGSKTGSSLRTARKGFITAADVEPVRYVLNLTDKSITRQIRNILEGSGTTSIANSRLGGANRSFKPEDYHMAVGAIHEMTWVYGYERLPRTGHVKKSEDDDEGSDPDIPGPAGVGGCGARGGSDHQGRQGGRGGRRRGTGV